jgi:hypothetical protein
MTPLQRMAVQIPCRSQDDRLDNCHAEWSRDGALAVLTVLTIDIERENRRGRGGMLPPGMGPYAWHASLSFHDVSSIAADDEGYHPEAPVIPICAQTDFHADAARMIFKKVFEGIGGQKQYADHGAEARHMWFDLTAVERQMAFGRTD